MTAFPRFDHVGITVTDLDAAVAFFGLVGLEPEGEVQVVEGDFVSEVIGIPGSMVENLMLAAPHGGTKLELSRFVTPDESREPVAQPANQPGLCNVCFEVADLQRVVDASAELGYELVGQVSDHEDVWRMCYVRGPDGVILSLAQSIGPGPDAD